MDQLAPDSYIYGFTDVNNNTIAHATTGKTVIAKNAGHMNFTDLPAMYSEAVKANGGEDPLFVFIAQEKTAPYAVNILQADEGFVRRGYDLFRELIGTYHDCKVKDNWWGYLGPENVINNLALPAWLAKEVE